MEDSFLLEMFQLAGVDVTTGKAKKLIEDTKVDSEIHRVQSKYDVTWNEAARMYHEDGVRVEDKKVPTKVKKLAITA
jgi:hypothetical protein